MSPSSLAISSTGKESFLPSAIPMAMSMPTPTMGPPDLAKDGAPASAATETPSLIPQLRRGARSNASALSGPSTTIRETTTVYILPGVPTDTSTPSSYADSDSVSGPSAGQRGGIAGGTVGAFVIAALLTVACYRRARRRMRRREGFLSLSDSSSMSEAAERGAVNHEDGDLFGLAITTTPSAVGSASDEPPTPDTALLGSAQGDHTSERVPIFFQPTRGTVGRYPGLPATPRPSIRRSDYLNPVVREATLMPLPLRTRRPALTRSFSEPWQMGFRSSARRSAAATNDQAPQQQQQQQQNRASSGARGKSMTSSVYSSEAAFTFTNSGTFGPRTSRVSRVTRASGTTDASGLRASTLANFPKPPPYTFSRGDGRGLGTTWRESFVFSPPEDEVLLAFPKLARQMEGQAF
ncbi:hypothetical protein J7T55_013791 [Diaporthe amygdali]|uniref:uncharacterized protein n=1 Tax=Phomopsis amygdali TaxID=1214568 RepID=UPI0022FE8423|nr:uncharacterized protein J7T55_013791 [Diaporthe amygdali]KAJ0119588.1 hypothetical protein J7T55_013791 [Diaporthe amygdali]